MHCCCLSWSKYLTHTCNFNVVFTLFYCAQEKILSTVLFVSSQGSNPKMTAESNCRYEVEWVTEYACHRDYLESHSCKLSSEQHDMSIDLTPLTLSCKLSPLESSDKSEPPEWNLVETLAIVSLCKMAVFIFGDMGDVTAHFYAWFLLLHPNYTKAWKEATVLDYRAAVVLQTLQSLLVLLQ